MPSHQKDHQFHFHTSDPGPQSSIINDLIVRHSEPRPMYLRSIHADPPLPPGTRVCDIRIGKCSQFTNAGSINAELFLSPTYFVDAALSQMDVLLRLETFEAYKGVVTYSFSALPMRDHLRPAPVNDRRFFDTQLPGHLTCIRMTAKLRHLIESEEITINVFPSTSVPHYQHAPRGPKVELSYLDGRLICKNPPRIDFCDAYFIECLDRHGKPIAVHPADFMPLLNTTTAEPQLPPTVI